MQYYLVFKDEKSNKFWSLIQEGESFTITFGKVGTAGQSQQKVFASTEAAQKEAEKLAVAKRKKGYADAEPPTNAPAPKKPPVVKQAASTTPEPPPAGPAPLADDGKPKPWHESEDEDEGRWFNPERLRQGLDEAEDKEGDTLSAAADPMRLKQLIAKHNAEDYPSQAFIFASIRGNFEDAVFLYENVNKPLGEDHCHTILVEGAEKILETGHLTPGDLKLLRWIRSEANLSVGDIISKYTDIDLPIMRYYVEQARKGLDLDELDVVMQQKLDECHEQAVPRMVRALRDLANYARTGASFKAKNTSDLPKMLPDGHFAKGIYGLRLAFRGENFYIRVLGNGNPSGDVCVSLPSLEGISVEISLPYLKKALSPQLETLWQEGVFEGLFEDAIMIREEDGRAVFLKHVINPDASAALQAQVEQLETGDDWEKNAGILPSVVNMMVDGVVAPADEERALALVLRHLRCPNTVASEAAYSLLCDYRDAPSWKYERAQWYFDNFSFESAMSDAEELVNEENYKPAEKLIQKFKMAAKRREALKLEGTPAAYGGGIQIKKGKETFEEVFTEKDLFMETANIMARAYKSGDIVLRFLVEGEEGYNEALDFINALLAKGYAGKTKNWTSSGGFALRVRFLHKPILIKQMAKAVVHGIDYPVNDAHRFFARAVQYPALRSKVQLYAELALQDFHWYSDLYDEANTVPGTFAATALAFCGLEYMPIVCHYAHTIDDEHTYIQLALPRALLKHYGVQPEVMPAIIALGMSNGQGGDMRLPKDLLATSGAASAVLAYARGMDMPEQSQMEHLSLALTSLMYDDEKKNLKKLREYVAVATDIQNKGALTELHNIYLDYQIQYGYDELYGNLGKPLPPVEGYLPQQAPFAQQQAGQNDDSDIEIERFPEALPCIMTLEEAAAAGIVPSETDEEYDDYDVPVSIFHSPAVQTDFELLHFTRTQWEVIGEENRKGSRRRCWARLLSGDEWMKMGEWIVDTRRFAADFGLILFDGKNKPLVLYGALNALNATLDFNANPPKTAQEAEKLRLRHLRYPSALRNTGDEALQADKFLDEPTGNLLRGDFSIAEAVLRHIKPEANPLTYLASRVMLAYIAQRRGDAEELAVLCDELAELQPEKRDFWLAKQALAQSV